MKRCLTGLFLISAITIHAQTITTIAGCGTSPSCISGGAGDGGPAIAAYTNADCGGAFDKIGNFYFGEQLGNRVRKVSPLGIITTFAGTGSSGFFGDGIVATSAKLSVPVAVAIDTMGNMYIADYNNKRIRKVDASTGIISTIAGDGTVGFYGEGIPSTAAKLSTIEDICLDKKGNLYLADHNNYRIRKIDTKGIITTVAGNGTFSSAGSGDGGPATVAGFNLLYGIAVDDTGSIFISDENAGRVRMIDTFGYISTFAGNGTYTYIGDGMPATNAQIAPGKLTFDLHGNLIIADFYNNRVYRVDHSGILHNIVGNTGVGTFSGDGGPATAAELYGPAGVTYDACGNLYVSESSNKRIRKVAYPPVLTVPTISLSGIITAPAGSTVTVTATVAKAGSSYIIHWLNKGVEFTTTTVPSVTYTKGAGTDTITARVVSTATYGCYDSTTSGQHIIKIPPVGIQQLAAATALSVYPNPARDVIRVNGIQESGAYKLLDMVGRVLQTGTVDNVNNEVNLKSVAKGVYLLEVNNNGGQKTISKIIKQ